MLTAKTLDLLVELLDEEFAHVETYSELGSAVRLQGIEPRSLANRARALPLDERRVVAVVLLEGFEPTLSRF